MLILAEMDTFQTRGALWTHRHFFRLHVFFLSLMDPLQKKAVFDQHNMLFRPVTQSEARVASSAFQAKADSYEFNFWIQNQVLRICLQF